LPCVGFDPLLWARSIQTAHQCKTCLGWVTISHPFHPLKGQKFEVLFVRSLPEKKILSLKNPSGGTFAVPHEWTDRESPLSQATILSAQSLLMLAELIQKLKDEVDK
jgi:Family of unknown function (DUF5372)